MFDFQDSLIFPVDAVPPAGPLLAGARPVQLTAADGIELHGIMIPPRSRPAGERLLVLGFGGNAWNGQHVAEYLHEIYPHCHVAAFHYRGYRPSQGRPSAEHLIADAPAIVDRLVEEVHPDRIVLAGFSIGSGIAASLAADERIAGLILVTPFDSLRAVAADLVPFAPIGPFFRHQMDSAQALRGCDIPVAILAAGQDEIVLPRRTAALRQEIPNLVFDRTIERAGHNDLYQKSDFQAAMREAVDALLSSTEKA